MGQNSYWLFYIACLAVSKLCQQLHLANIFLRNRVQLWEGGSNVPKSEQGSHVNFFQEMRWTAASSIRTGRCLGSNWTLIIQYDAQRFLNWTQSFSSWNIFVWIQWREGRTAIWMWEKIQLQWTTYCNINQCVGLINSSYFLAAHHISALHKWNKNYINLQ